MFQFYLSSIKSRLLDILKKYYSQSFNSTLVQLKATLPGSPLNRLILFQFYLSSIKRRPENYIRFHDSTFQFYLSSIKREEAKQEAIDTAKFQFYLSSIKR